MSPNGLLIKRVGEFGHECREHLGEVIRHENAAVSIRDTGVPFPFVERHQAPAAPDQGHVADQDALKDHRMEKDCEGAASSFDQVRGAEVLADT